MHTIIKSIAWILLAVLLMAGGIVASSGFDELDAFAQSNSPALKLTSASSLSCSFQLDVAQPGACGKSAKMLENVGDHSGNLGIQFSPVINTPGNTGEFADHSGDLGATTMVALYVDLDLSGKWSSGDKGLRSDGTIYGYSESLDYKALNGYSSLTWNDLALLKASSLSYLVVEWQIPVTVGNEIQGDSVSFDITFTLDNGARQVST
jgi:hypothetical protein